VSGQLSRCGRFTPGEGAQLITNGQESRWLPEPAWADPKINYTADTGLYISIFIQE